MDLEQLHPKSDRSAPLLRELCVWWGVDVLCLCRSKIADTGCLLALGNLCRLDGCPNSIAVPPEGLRAPVKACL